MRKEQLRFSLVLTALPLRAIACAALALIFSACGSANEVKFLDYEIVATHPHDTGAFTQGLAILDGQLLESTGRNGQSALWLKDIASGKVLRRAPLDARYFGEGLAVAHGRILQLT
ncbi:MAG: glutaminyl-peptide cyclotransferase, partial [Hydrocarboniphaga effusa]|nr:glutaminyl-peptide cyclotransferase [Hydrocarboniphaga effusa]